MDEPPSGVLLFFNLFDNPVFFFSLSGLLLLALLILSAIISGSEVAFFSLSSKDIAKCRSSKSTQEHNIVLLLDHPKRLLATILILNNLVNVAFVILSTYVSWAIFGGSGTNDVLVVFILTVVNTFAIVLFGEIIPKVYANQNNLQFAKRTTKLWQICGSIFHPLSWLLMSLSSIIEKRVEKKGYDISMDELGHALEITTDEHTSEEEKEILKGIVNFGSLTVKQVMHSRLDITAFDIEIDFHTLVQRINELGYSRIPVYRETIDKIEGILYVKDLLPHLDMDKDFAWQNLLRSGFFVPESKKIDSLLRDFQEKRVHMAIVVDEYGGTSGLLTMEDIIEEIVGEINDEFDEDDVVYNKLDDQTFIFEGKTSLNDFCKVINEEASIFEEVKGESESLGGLLLELHSKMPRAGDKINFDKFVFTIVSVDSKRIKRIRVYIKTPA
ncbi:gliding motility-associated protein GldE [Splendidivirga corallicola]|uniref:gliding motility-associated protein GldE n=1 Tax=Splendidivirga corallicola TaxID=3051826 RepID=UPI003D2C698F